MSLKRKDEYEKRTKDDSIKQNPDSTDFRFFLAQTPSLKSDRKTNTD